MELFSEVPDTMQVLKYKVNKERGEAKQPEIINANNKTSWSSVS